MKNLWNHHFKYYDLFQMNRDDYVKTIRIFLSKVKNCKIILDSGAGSGNLTLELLKRGHKVVVIDLNEYALKILKKKCKNYRSNLIVRKKDVQNTNFNSKSFDAVTSMFVVPFVKDNKKYFSEVYRVLKEKGIFIITIWSPVKDSWKGIMGVQEKELTKKGILPKYNKAWDYAKESARVAVKDVFKGNNLTKLKRILKDVGFKNIKSIKSPYGKYAYLISCVK